MVSVLPWNMHDKRPTNESAPWVVIASTIIPRAPEPERGFIKAVGSAPTHWASKPQRCTAHDTPSMSASIAPLARNTPIATSIATRCAHAVHHRRIERGETPDDAGHCQGGAAECEEQRAVEEVDALKKRGDDHAGQGRKEGGQEDGDENVRGIGRTLLCTIDHDGDRNEREPTCVEHQEHNHGIARAIFLRVEFLQSFHGLKAERRGGIVESKHVGRDIHKDVSHHRMAFRHFGKEAFEERPEQSCHKLDHSATFADLHHPHPEGKYPGEADRNLKSRLGRFESGVHDGGKHVEVAEK